MDHDGLTTGAEWIVDARGCVEEGLRRLSSVQDFCGLVIRELSLKVVGEPQWHQFAAPGGVTGLYLLTESHLAVHTFPELGLITLNLYCCRPRQEFDWTAALESHFRATDVRVIRIARGGLPVGSESPSCSFSPSGEKVADRPDEGAFAAPSISERPPHPALSPAGERELARRDNVSSSETSWTSPAGEKELSAPKITITQEAQG